MDYVHVTERLAEIEEKIAAACLRSGRKQEDITLLAVTKFHPVEAVLSAHKAGLRTFGENRVQEALEKYNDPRLQPLRGAISLHLLGHLQSNKANKALSLFDCIESADSMELVELLGKKTGVENKKIGLCFELHTGEASKSGFSSELELRKALERALAFPGLRVLGLMTMAPYTQDFGKVRASFRQCAGLYEQLKLEYQLDDFSVLSMGMSNDYEIAVEEGATLLRIGTALFGERVYE